MRRIAPETEEKIKSEVRDFKTSLKKVKNPIPEESLIYTNPLKNSKRVMLFSALREEKDSFDDPQSTFREKTDRLKEDEVEFLEVRDISVDEDSMLTDAINQPGEGSEYPENGDFGSELQNEENEFLVMDSMVMGSDGRYTIKSKASEPLMRHSGFKKSKKVDKSQRPKTGPEGVQSTPSDNGKSKLTQRIPMDLADQVESQFLGISDTNAESVFFETGFLKKSAFGSSMKITEEDEESSKNKGSNVNTDSEIFQKNLEKNDKNRKSRNGEDGGDGSEAQNHPKSISKRVFDRMYPNTKNTENEENEVDKQINRISEANPEAKVLKTDYQDFNNDSMFTDAIKELEAKKARMEVQKLRKRRLNIMNAVFNEMEKNMKDESERLNKFIEELNQTEADKAREFRRRKIQLMLDDIDDRGYEDIKEMRIKNMEKAEKTANLMDYELNLLLRENEEVLGDLNTVLGHEPDLNPGAVVREVIQRENAFEESKEKLGSQILGKKKFKTRFTAKSKDENFRGKGGVGRGKGRRGGARRRSFGRSGPGYMGSKNLHRRRPSGGLGATGPVRKRPGDQIDTVKKRYGAQNPKNGKKQPKKKSILKKPKTQDADSWRPGAGGSLLDHPEKPSGTTDQSATIKSIPYDFTTESMKFEASNTLNTHKAAGNRANTPSIVVSKPQGNEGRSSEVNRVRFVNSKEDSSGLKQESSSSVQLASHLNSGRNGPNGGNLEGTLKSIPESMMQSYGGDWGSTLNSQQYANFQDGGLGSTSTAYDPNKYK